MSTESIKILKKCPVIDVHCHPTIKMKMLGMKFTDEHPVVSRDIDFWYFLGMQVDLPKMDTGRVGAIFSSIYIPEKKLVDGSNFLSFVENIFGPAGIHLEDWIEDPVSDNCFKQAKTLLYKMDVQVNTAKNDGLNVVSAKSYSELVSAFENGKHAIMHSVEGVHMLGRGLANTQDYLNNIDLFYNLGVCSLTLGHFFENDAVYPVDGISPHTRESFGMSPFVPSDQGLSPVGEAIVRHLLEKGIVIDLDHSNLPARKIVFEINESRCENKRPIAFTHAGVRGLFDVPYNPSDWEIDQIKKCDGIIGIIFMNYWLNGVEDPNDDYGIKNIIKTIKYIHEKTGTFDNIAIGSDLDGFTEPMDDLYDASNMPRLVDSMLNHGIQKVDIEKILCKNAMRVLEKGWGRQ